LLTGVEWNFHARTVELRESGGGVMPITILVVALAAGTAGAPPKVGQPAPDFVLNDQNGHPVRLSDFRGKKSVVLAFYIRAFTPG
jgi:hypothetical protein